jgi:hypothetical protein
MDYIYLDKSPPIIIAYDRIVKGKIILNNQQYNNQKYSTINYDGIAKNKAW